MENSPTPPGGHKQIAEVTERIEVRWPNGEAQSWSKVAGNRTIRITEGQRELRYAVWVK